jgi:hypothetical protein
MLEPVRYDRQECSEHYFEGRYDGLDMHNNFALRVAIGDLRMMSQKWRTRG